MKAHGLFIAAVCFVLAANFFSCRNDGNVSPSIEKIAFETSQREMYAGEQATLKITVTPKEARGKKRIEYGASPKGVVIIDEENSSNDGVIVKAAGPGSAVVTARVNGLVDYCNIKVEGDPEVSIPYISLTNNVIEMKLGTKRHVAAALQGGMPGDQNNFIFSSKDDTVSIDSANNTVVIEGIKTGSARITASHPKAQYSVDILAFVLAEGEFAKYITGENVVFMTQGQGVRNYSISIVGLPETEMMYSIFQVIQGSDVITVKGSGDSCTIEAKKPGVAKVEVVNQSVPYPFVFQVVVKGTAQARYITVPTNFMIINGQDYYSIGASMAGDLPDDFQLHYSYTLSEEGVAEITQTRGSFQIKGLKNGTTVLTIKNKYSEVDAQVLLLVRDSGLAESGGGGKYIRTSQQLIYMDAGKGAADAVLKMELVGGTGADQNDFEWLVEDSSVISVAAPGNLRYTRAQAVSQPLAVEAVITAKKEGTSRITVSNRKALNDVTVMVKVFPQGTFAGKALYVSGPGLIKVKAGETQEVFLSLVGGDAQYLDKVTWSVPQGDQGIAKADGSYLTGYITGVKQGVTRVKVSGANIAQEYEALIVVYEEGKEDSAKYAYTDKLHYRLTVGQVTRAPIFHPNIPDEQFSFSVVNTNKDSIYYTVSKNALLINGLGPGSGELVINTAGADCNNITLYITVEPAALMPEKPYMLTGENFAGVNEGAVVSYTVALAGAGAGKLNGIAYSVDDEKVAKIIRRSGNTVEIEGVAKGQTVLRASHAESVNEKAVVVYVVERGKPVTGVIVIGIEKSNYVMNVNESLFLRLVTNAAENQKTGFRWKNPNEQGLVVESNYDTAVITALEPGNFKVTVYVEGDRHLVDLDIFITVREGYANYAEIGFPDSIVLVKNQNKVLKGNVSGAFVSNGDILYSLEDEGVASFTAQGLEAVMRGLEKGQTFLTISSEMFNYYKKVLVICAETEEAAAKAYFFTVGKTMHRIKVNEEVRVSLLFGGNGFPEAEKALIEWELKESSQVVLLGSPRGQSNTIVGKNEGQAVIQIKSRLMEKPVEVVVEVAGEASGSEFYRFIYTPIHQMTRNKVEMVPVSIYYGAVYVNDYDNSIPGIKLEYGYSAIKVAVSDTAVADAVMVGQNLRVTAKSQGKTIITLSHDMISEDAKLLIAVYEGEPDSSALVIFVPKTHWLIPQGGTREVVLHSNRSGTAGLGNIMWVNRSPGLFTVDSADKTKAVITAVKEGSGTVTIEAAGQVLETVYISVSSGNNKQASAVTESIIVLSMKDAELGPYRTRVVSNVENISQAYWEASDLSVIEIAPMGAYCDIYPARAGISELKVSGYGFERTIVVKIVGTEEEKASARVMNLDTRYFKIKKGENVLLNPYYKPAKPFIQTAASLVFDNKVLSLAMLSGGASVTGKNVGIEHIKFYNEGADNKGFEVVFEVDDQVTQGGVGEYRNFVYLSTDTPIVMIKPDDTNYMVYVSVIGEYHGGADDFKWETDSSRISLASFGAYALISGKGQDGEAQITVTNQFCDGLPAVIKVIITGNITVGNNGQPYLYSQKNVYTMQRGQGDLSIPVEVRGAANVSYNLVSLMVTGVSVQASCSNGVITAREASAGTTLIEVYYPGIETPLKIYIIVQEQFKTGSAYLTTGQNYVVVNRHSSVVINASLVNYTEPDSSKFSWASADPSVAYPVGNGLAVQILGMELGTTKVTVRHPVSYNDLDIIVKVVQPGNAEEVVYLTTGDNIIETYAGAGQGQISVNKVGGITNVINAQWTVDDPSIVSVLGNNDTAYYTPRKEGTARITVTDKEAGPLSIVVIVRKRKAGSQFLFTASPIVQITPNSSNNTVRVELDGGDESDEVNFRWEIYTQLPADINIARQGGAVVSIFAMGGRCSVNGIYAGTARIKVTHPKAAEALFILVQVTNFKEMRFTQKNISMEKDDMMFISLETPDYDNYSGRVKYASDNPSVCTVYGTAKAALVSSYMPGKAVISAYVEHTDLYAEVTVTVLAERDYGMPYIITPKTTFVLNPRELPFIIEAQLYGVGVSEQDWDTLVWEVQNNEDDILKIYPENAGEPGKSVGRSVQVSVRNREYAETKSCTIEISAPHLTRRVKTIFVQVQEDTNAFTLSKDQVTVQANETTPLSCNILGGKNSDYDEVLWMIDPDGFDPTKEIVRIMGSGKTVQLLALNDGVTQITAMYRGMAKTCLITVKSSVFLGIQYQNFLTYPGERGANGGLIGIHYEVRPVRAFIQWMDTDTNINEKIALVSYTQPEDDGLGTGRGLILIDPLREGQFSIIGVSNHKNARLNIIVKNDLKFTLDRYEIDETPFGDANNMRGEPKTEADTTVGYFVSPANASISPKSHSLLELSEMGITMIVSEPAREEDSLRSKGTIYFKCVKECSVDLVLETLKQDGSPTGLTAVISIKARMRPGYGRLIPVFQRVFGMESNGGSAAVPYVASNNNFTGVLYPGKGGEFIGSPRSFENKGTHNEEYDLVIEDGSEQYILLDPVNTGASISGVSFEWVKDAGYDLGKQTRHIEAVRETRDGGETAIRISGGDDFVVFSGFGSEFDFYNIISGPSVDSMREYRLADIKEVPLSFLFEDRILSTVSEKQSFVKNAFSAIITQQTTAAGANPVKYDVKEIDGTVSVLSVDVIWKSMGGGHTAATAFSIKNLEDLSGYYYYPQGKASLSDAAEKPAGLSRKGNIPWYTLQNNDDIITKYYIMRNLGNTTDSPYDHNEINGNYVLLSASTFVNSEFSASVLLPRIYVKNNGPQNYYNTKDNPILPIGIADKKTAYMLNNILYYNGPKTKQFVTFNFVYGKIHYWDLNTDVFEGKPAKVEPLAELYDLTDNHSAITNINSNNIEKNFSLGNARYERRDSPDSLLPEKNKIFSFYRFTNYFSNYLQRGLEPVGDITAFTNRRKRFYMMNIFKERYDPANEGNVIDPYANEGEDARITNSPEYEKYPYRYFPLCEPDVSECFTVPAGQIRIKYRNSYGENLISIKVFHKVQSGFVTNKDIINDVAKRKVLDWREVKEVNSSNVFPSVKGVPVNLPNYAIFRNSVFIEKGY